MRARASERGWALVSVLWGLVIISLIAAVMLSSARVTYRQAAYSVEQAQGRARANAATARAVLGLLDTRMDHRWRIDGVLRSWTFDGHEMQVSVQDEGGKIDLNASGETAIRQLLNAVAPDAKGLADKILDWRDQKGDQHRLEGATRDDYAAAGLAYRPRGSLFQSVDELKLVLGMTPALFERIKPAVTVYSGRSKVNLATAPKDVLMALLAEDDQTAAATIAARQAAAPAEQGQSQPIVSGVVANGIPIDGWAFSIQSKEVVDRRAQGCVVMLTPKALRSDYYQEMTDSQFFR